MGDCLVANEKAITIPMENDGHIKNKNMKDFLKKVAPA